MTASPVLINETTSLLFARRSRRARAWVTRGTIDDVYEGLVPAPEIVDITYFEVIEACWRQGIGRAAVALIAQRYKGEMLIAVSEEADDFWAGIGWTHNARRENPEQYRPLFVLDSRNVSSA